MKALLEPEDKEERQACVGQIGKVKKLTACFCLALCGLMVLLSGCSLFPTPVQGTNASDQDTPTPAPTGVLSATPRPTFTPPVITLQVVNCPTLAINWDSVVGAKSGVNKVQRVVCGNLEGNGALTALVIVRYYSPDSKMDCYVYDNLTGTPNKRFSDLGLIEGDAQISMVNTLTTAQLVSPDPIPLNVFKEYRWNAATGTFAQTLFPGMYPDATRYQAEHSQALVGSTNTTVAAANSWRLSGSTILKKLAFEIFHWTTTDAQNVTFNNVRQVYIVNVLNMGTGGGGFTATLFHMNNVVTNVFEVSQIVPLDTNTVVNAPTGGVQLSSPVTVSGVGQVNGTVLGQALFYDDTYTIVGDSGPIRSTTSSGYVNFTQLVKYRLNARGLQEGIVAFFETNQSNVLLTNQVFMIKVLFSA